MATQIFKTVKPSGGDYTSLVTALADMPLNFITADEKWIIEIYKKAGGYNEKVTIPSITCDATRHLEIRAALGDKYNRHTGEGVLFSTSVGYAGVFNATTADYLKVLGIGVYNTRTLSSGRGFQSSANNSTIEDVFATTDSTSGATCFLLNNANNLTIRNTLAEDGTTGFDFGNNNVRLAENLTSANNITYGFKTGTASTTLKNSLYIGIGTGYSGTFNALSDYNASSDNSAVGANSVQNISTAELVDYAGADFRTSESGSLATAGEGGGYIGFELEPSAAAPVDITVSDISTSPTVDATALQDIASLSVSDISTLTSVDSVSIVNISSLSVSSLLTSPALDSLNIESIGSVSASDISSAPTVDSISLSALGDISLSDLSVAPTLDTVSISQAQQIPSLTVNGLITEPKLDSLSIENYDIVSVNDIATNPTVDAVSIYSSVTVEIANVVIADSTVKYSMVDKTVKYRIT